MELGIATRCFEHARRFPLQLADLSRDRFELRARDGGERGIRCLNFARDLDQVVTCRQAGQRVRRSRMRTAQAIGWIGVVVFGHLVRALARRVGHYACVPKDCRPMVLHRTAELRTLLERLEPADALEETHRTRILALLADASDPFEREHYTPGHVTASAFVLDPARERVLLILHGKLGRWLQPGGHVDASDSSIALAACREVLEETGLDVKLDVGTGVAPAIHLLDVDVHEIPARGAAPAHEHFDVRFAFEATHTHARAGSDAKQARWVSIAQLLSGGPDLPTDESVMRAVRKLSRRLS